MPDQHHPTALPSQAPIYHVRLKGHLGSQWADWFGGLAVTQAADGETVLSGPVIDQAALHGLLKKVRDLGITLVAVTRVEPGAADAPEANQETIK